MSDITVLTVEQLAEFLRKLINGEVLTRDELIQILYTIAILPEADKELLEILKAQEQSEV